MGAKITFDATNRKFVVTQAPNAQGVITIDLQVDLYSDAKEDWQNDGTYPELAGMKFPIDAIGGNPFGAKTLGISYLIKYGWSFKPYEADHTLVLVGNIGTETGWELVDDTVGSYRVRVENEVSSIVSLENLSFLESAAYSGSVIVDSVNGQPGTSFPIGTHSAPVNNILDAIVIAENRGLGVVQFESDFTLDADAQLQGYILTGASPVVTTLTVEAAAGVMNCEFRNVTVTGILDGGNVLRECIVTDISNFYGFMFNCGLQQTITLGNGQASVFDCYSNVAGGGVGQYVDIDFNGANAQVALRNYSGGIEIKNATVDTDSSYDMASGRIIFASTCTDGTHTVRGVGDVYDNSTGAAEVTDLTLNKEARHSRRLLSNRQELVDAGATVIMRTYADDGVTVLEENVVTDPLDNKPNLPTGSTTKRAAPT